jgi:hypothetical protein
MYALFLTLHSLVRWVVVVLAVVVVVRALLGWRRSNPWTELDNRLGLFFTIGLDVQVLLGVILYLFLSPLVGVAFQDFGAAMRDSELRYWGVEHIALMIIALVLAHAGRSIAKRASDAIEKHKRALIFYGLSVLIILLAIPWWRPLLRLG